MLRRLRVLVIVAMAAAVSFSTAAVAQSEQEEKSAPETPSDSQAPAEGRGAETSGDEEKSGEREEENESEEQSGSTGSPGGAANKGGERYELRELLRRAKNNQDLLDEFEAKRDEAEWQQYRAKWAPTPEFRSLTTLAPVPAEADEDSVNRNFEEIGAFDIGPFVRQDIDLTVPVFGFGRIGALRDLAAIGVDVAGLKEREAKLNAVFQTKRAYYTLQLSRTVSPMLEKGDGRIEERLQEMEDARDFGTADFETKDFRKLQILSARVDTRISENEKLGEVSTSGLRYLADLEAERFEVGRLSTDAPLKPLADFEVYFEAAKENRPDLQQLDKAVEARRARLRLEKRNFFPKVFIQAGLGFGFSNKSPALNRVCRRDGTRGSCENTDNLWARPENNPFSRFSLSIAAGMRWKLDPVQQHGKVKVKEAKLRQIEAKRRRAIGGIRTKLRKKYNDAVEQREKVAINDRRLEAARKWRNQKGLTMQTAGKELDEMDDAVRPLKEFFQAKAKFLEARYRYKVARAALAQGVGVVHLDSIEKEAGVEGAGGETPSDGAGSE